MTTGTSLRQFARLIGVSEKAVRKALAGGVFSAHSVLRDAENTPSVIDVSLAIAEWEKSGRQLRAARQRTAPEASTPAAPAAATPGRASSVDTPAVGLAELLGDDPDEPETPAGDVSLVSAQRDAMVERARKLRLENDEREGLLIDVNQASKEAFEFARVLREAVLNVPARLAAELAVETDATRVSIRLDAALREALQATATGLAEPKTTEVGCQTSL